MENKIIKAKGSLSERRPKRERQQSEFIHQQTLVIKKMLEKRNRIPKDYQHFEKFIKKLVNWDPPRNVIFAIWNKLCLAEEKVYGHKPAPPVIDLSDDDDCVIISESPPKIGDLCPVRSEFKISVSKPNSDGPLTISNAFKKNSDSHDNTHPVTIIDVDCYEETSDVPLPVSSNACDLIPQDTISVSNDCIIIPEASLSESNVSEAPESDTVDPEIIWYLSPVKVNDTPSTSAKSTPRRSSKGDRKNKLKMKLETNTICFQEITKDKKTQRRKKKEKPIVKVKPLNVFPITEPGASATQSSKHKSVNPNRQQTRERRKPQKLEDEPLTEEQAMELRQIMLIDKVIELELPKILQDQTGGSIPQSIIREHIQKVLKLS